MTLNGSPSPQPPLEPQAETEASPPWESRLALRLRGFGPLGLFAIGIILFAAFFFVPLSALMVLVWTRLSSTPWRAIGYVRPKSWIGSLCIGLVFGIAFKFVLKAVVMPLLGADPINHPFHYLVGNHAAIPGFLLTILGAGFGEETLFRGYMFERLTTLLGSGRGVKLLIIVATSALFGLAHYTVQGVSGTEQAAVVGLVFAAVFAATGRIFVLMSAHFFFDLTAYAIIYWDLESKVAHLVFK